MSVKKKTFKADQLYKIRLNRFAELDGVKFRPSLSYRVKGKIVTALGDAVQNAKEA